MLPISKDKHPKQKKRRTFTGCYTCRQRKIKCDNTKPSCLRCLKSKIQCLGYDIKLRWSKPLSIGSNQLIEIGSDEIIEEANVTKRRNIAFMKFDKNYVYDQDLDLDLNYCNSDNLKKFDRNSLSKGPFSIFNGEYFGVKTIVKSHDSLVLAPDQFLIRTNDSNMRSTYSSSMGDDDEDTTEVWVDKRFVREAKSTSYFLLNEVTDSIKDINKIIFSKYFELENEMSMESLMKMYRHGEFSQGIIGNRMIFLNESSYELVRFFVDNIYLMMPITFKGNIYETLIIPTIYQYIGQIVIGNEKTFSFSIKTLIIKQVLCLASFLKYEKCKEFKYLQMSVDFRREIIFEMTELICSLTDENDKFVRNTYMNGLIFNYEIKNIVLVFILMIKIDYFIQILENFNKWFKLTDNLISFLNSYNDSILNNLTFKNLNEKLTLDKFNNLKKLIKLYRFIKIFYFSTAKIDIDNYELGNEKELFQDIVDQDYNLIKGDFIFDDGFSKIDDYLDIMIKKPQMILLEDKPTFTINFNNNQHVNSEDEEGTDEDTEVEDDENTNDDDDEDDEEEDIEKVAMIDIPQPDNDTVFVGDIEDDVNKFSSIEYMYGLPLSLLELFNKIITLTNHKNFFTRRKLFPRNYPKLCCDLEEDLLNWKLTWKLFDDSHKYKSLFHEILYHNILSFYNSLCLYFERIIKESDPSLLQDYVRNSLKHLKRLIEIDDFNTKISPLFWSYFISSCDAIEHDLQMEFSKISMKFVGNNWISKQIILEVWKKRTEGFHQVCWLDIVKNWDCDVLLIC